MLHDVFRQTYCFKEDVSRERPCIVRENASAMNCGGVLSVVNQSAKRSAGFLP